MRIRHLGVALLLLAATPPVVAQEDEALLAAVAPAQTVVDAGARVIARALQEADRDGTPDEAERILADIDAFVRTFDAEIAISGNATHRAEALAALSYARRIQEALADLPDAAADVAVVAYGCSDGVVESEARDRLFLGLARLEALKVLLVAVADDAPRGVDARGIAREASEISSWITSYDIAPRCKFEPDPYLTVEVVPDRAWPTSEVRIVGATNVNDTVQLFSPILGLDATVTVSDERFGARWVIPEDARLGQTIVVARASGLEAAANLTIARAPSELIVLSERHYAAGIPFSLDVRLISPLRERVENATIHVSGFRTADVTLENGSVRVPLVAPTEPGTHVLSFTFDGERLIEPSNATVEIRVLPPPPVAPAVQLAAAPPVVATLQLSILLGVALVMALLVGIIAVRIRARRAAARAGLWRPPPRRIFAAFSAGDITAAFGSLVAWLRRAGRLPLSATAREAATALHGWGADPGPVVYDFERARYGNEPPRPDAMARVKAWAANAWSKLRKAEQP